MVGRHTPSQHLPNDRIHEIVGGHAELIGIGSVDPALQGERAAIEEIERAVGTLGLKGIDIEPGFGRRRAIPTTGSIGRSTSASRSSACRSF